MKATATVGKAAEMLPPWLMLASSLLLLALSVRPLARIIHGWKQGSKESSCCGNQETPQNRPALQPFPASSSGCGCGCNSSSNSHPLSQTQQDKSTCGCRTGKDSTTLRPVQPVSGDTHKQS